LESDEKEEYREESGDSNKSGNVKKEQQNIITSHKINNALYKMCSLKTILITPNSILAPQTEKGLTTPQNLTTTPETQQTLLPSKL
jgi:hypothetical protein